MLNRSCANWPIVSDGQNRLAIFMRELLLCPPDHYGIEYEINPWMSRARGAETEVAQAQWKRLHDTLSGLDCKIHLITPQSGLPDMVFTANAGLTVGKKFIPSNFRHKERAAEAGFFADWMEQHGYEVNWLPENFYFEGEGDALFGGDALFCGYKFRSDIQSHRATADMLGCLVISVELVDPRFYHLDTCFCPIDAKSAIYYPPAFDDYARRALSQIPRLIAVNEEEAARFACNAVVVGTDVVLNAGCPQLESDLRAAGFTPHATELGEFLKSGGSAKCLTIRLDGETTAVWPQVQ